MPSKNKSPAPSAPSDVVLMAIQYHLSLYIKLTGDGIPFEPRRFQ